MKTYQNTFETLGDPCPYESESPREFAKAFLPMFNKLGNWYQIDPQPIEARVGSIKEIEWWDRLYESSTDGLISEERLLDFLEEAVEER